MFSIKSLILLTALAVIFVLLTVSTVSATVNAPWTRVAVDTTSTIDIQCAKVGDADNDGLVEIVIGVDGTGDGIYMYESPSPDSTLRFIDPTPANYTQEQDFTWGVLAINTHKSIYLPNEAAFIGIAVLDNEGHMICDADVTLTITDPSNIETVLSTSNGLIKISPQCCVYGVTSLPDYYTNYEVDGAGTYVMNLTAVTANGTKSIADEFSVQNSVDFDVARDGATRLYPPVPYVMNFTIKANEDYDGLIREYVPASFDISPQDGLTITTIGDTKILSWNKNLVKEETYNIHYEFDAPDISPYLFTLGALEIGSFKEVRQWQIASDATVTYYFNAYDSGGEEWKTNPGNMVDGTETSYASTSHPNDIELLTTNTCPGTDLGAISKVEIRAYGYYTTANDEVELRPVFTGGDGNNHLSAVPSSAGWGTTFDITTDTNAPPSWTWSNVINLDCDVEYYKTKKAQPAYVGKVEIIVTYTAPTWVSYSDSGYTTECNNFASYENEHTVYMHGSGFTSGTAYRIIFWDGTGANRKTDDKTSDGDLSSSHTFVAGTDQPGTWYATVYYPQSYSPGSHDPNDANLVVDDTFEVQQSAIPEFPTVIAAIAVCMLCAISYMVMRRKVGKG